MIDAAYDESKRLPQTCGNFLADLPHYLGLETPALEKEQIYSHIKNCKRCWANYTTAREIAGAFYGLKQQTSAYVDTKYSFTIERATNLALRENRNQLAEIFFEIGKALLLDAIKQNCWIQTYTPIPDINLSRKIGVATANDSIFLEEENSLLNIREYRDHLTGFSLPTTSTAKLMESVKFFNVALTLRPNYERALNGLGLTRHLQNDYPGALSFYRRILDESRSLERLFEAHINSGFSYAELGQFDEAIVHSEKACRIHPKNPSALCNLFFSYLVMGDNRRSCQIGEQIEEQAEQDPRVRQTIQISLKALPTGDLNNLLCSKSTIRKMLNRQFPKTFTTEILSRFEGV